jgi:hypothetical protein
MSAHANHGYCKGKDIQESLSIEEKKPSIKTTKQKNTKKVQELTCNSNHFKKCG